MKIIIVILFSILFQVSLNAQQLTARGSYTKKLDSIVYLENFPNSFYKYKIHYTYNTNDKINQKVFYLWDTIANKFNIAYERSYQYIGDSILNSNIHNYNPSYLDSYMTISYRNGSIKEDSTFVKKSNAWKFHSKDLYFYNSIDKLDSTYEFIFDTITFMDKLYSQRTYTYDINGNQIAKSQNLLPYGKRDYFTSKFYNSNHQLYHLRYGRKVNDTSIFDNLVYDNFQNLDSVYSYSMKQYNSVDKILLDLYSKFRYDNTINIENVLSPYSHVDYGKPYKKMLLEETQNFIGNRVGLVYNRKFYYSDYSTSAINNIQLNEIQIAPNPCSTCELITSKQINTKDYIISDLLGKQVNVSFEKSPNGYKIQLPKESRGIYFLQNNQSGEVIRFVKE